MNKALKWEIGGTIFVVLLGGALHFVFELSGEWQSLAIAAWGHK